MRFLCLFFFIPFFAFSQGKFAENNFDSIVEQELESLFNYPVDPLVQKDPVYYHYDSLEHGYGKRTTYNGVPVSGVMYGLFDSAKHEFSFKMTLSNGWLHGPFITYFEDTSGRIACSGYYDTINNIVHLTRYYDNGQVKSEAFYKYELQDWQHWRENPEERVPIHAIRSYPICEMQERYTEYYRNGQLKISTILDTVCYQLIIARFGTIWCPAMLGNCIDTTYIFHESGLVSEFFVYKPDKKFALYRTFDESANLIWEQRIKNNRIRYRYIDEFKGKLVTKRQWRLWFDWKFKKQLPPEEYP